MSLIRDPSALFALIQQRRAAEIRWESVDLHAKTLHIPSPKGGKDRAFTLPLSDYLVNMFEARQKGNVEFFPKSPFVFPATSRSGRIVSPNTKKVGVPFALHDLRRVFITTAESLNLSPYTIKILVNHTLPKSDVTGGYIQHETERLRVPMQQISNRLCALCSPQETTVLRMKGTAT